MGARAIQEPEWSEGFRRVLASARVALRPGLWRAGPRGARVANALALPSLHGPHVLFTETLLECLDEEERTAVLAHEVSHLELFTRSLLVRWQWGTFAAIATAAMVFPATERVPAEWRWVGGIAWPLVVLVTLTSRGRVIRAQEEPSDRRAVELSGNAEAVVSGLVKLHETARLPRRWAMAHEQHASHPSLARRIRAIRAAAGQPPAQVPFPVVLRGTDGSAIVLEADRVRYLTKAPASEETLDGLLAGAASAMALPWTDVGELRVDARGTRVPGLVLADRRGTRWTVALAAADVPRVQAALDAVDERLPAVLPAGAGRVRLARVVLVALCALLLVALPWSSALIVAALALLVPGPAALLASAVAAIAAGLLAAAQGVSTARIALAIAVAGCGAWLASVAWRWRREGGPDDRIVHPIAGLSAVIAWTAVVLYAWTDAFALHVAAKAVPALAILPFATAAAWAWAREPRFRRGLAVPLLLGAIGVALSTTAWVDVVVRDPLRAGGSGLPVTTARLTAIDRADVDASASELWLSPSATFAIAPEPPDDDEEDESAPLEFTLGNVDGLRRSVSALALQVPDDEHVVTIEREGDELAVRMRLVTAPETPTWSARIPASGWGTLGVDPRARRWSCSSRPRQGSACLPGRSMPRPWRTGRAVCGDGHRYAQWLATDGEPLGLGFDATRRGTADLLVREALRLPWRLPLTLRFPGRSDLRSRFDGTRAPGRAVAAGRLCRA